VILIVTPPKWRLREHEVSMCYLPLTQEEILIPGQIPFIQGSIWEVLELGLKFNAITFCRIPDLPDQIKEDCIAIITDGLLPGGVALLSSSRRYEERDLINICKESRDPNLDITLKRLNSVGDPLDSANEGHFGLVIRKH
jgi:hypothetical protein